jgi:hypothetical protein
MLKSVDHITIMYSMGDKANKLLHSLSGLKSGARHRTFVIRKFKNIDDISTFLQEEALKFFGVAMASTKADEGGAEENRLGAVANTLLGNVPIDEKLALLDGLSYTHRWQVLKAMENGDTDDISKAANVDLDNVGIHDADRRAMFLAACKMYRAASLYNNMKEDRSPQRRREAAYYNAGVVLASMIKDGTLADYSFLLTAAVRSNDFEKCPFGLPITEGCKNIGSHIDKLPAITVRDDKATSDDKRTSNTLALKRVMRHEKQCGKCKYARSFMKSKSNTRSVVCNYGEANAGVDTPDFSTGVGAAYPTSFWAGLFTIPSALGPEARDSWFARSPGATPFGQTMINTPGM